jgi:nucleotide-binding universal stress UspA family protein
MDGSPSSFKALNQAIYLARQCHSTITGLCIIPTYTINLGKLLTSLKNQSQKEAKKILADAKKICAQNGILFNEKIIYGNQSWEITEFATYKKFELIVIGSRGMSRVKEAFLGSVANMVAHKSKISVLIVK